jgi:hypothetical protein
MITTDDVSEQVGRADLAATGSARRDHARRPRHVREESEAK